MGKATFEQPGSGVLLGIKTVGTYVCATCGAALFSSQDKRDAADDYATFTAPITEGAVNNVRTYSVEGNEESVLQCAQCAAEVGFIGNFVLRSADDLEQGQAQMEYKVSSRAVRFKKAFSLSRYPVGVLLALLVFGGLAYGVWYAFTTFENGTVSNTDPVIQLWLGDVTLHAKPVVLEEALASGSIPPIESGTLLLVIPPNSAGIRIRLANTQFDVLWLDEHFKTVSFETIDPQKTDILTPPTQSKYGLVTQPGVIVEQARVPGYEVIVINNANLL